MGITEINSNFVIASAFTVHCSSLAYIVEKREILSLTIFFRQINSMVTSLVRKNVSFTKFLRKKRERGFLQLSHSTCGNYGNSLSHFWQKFREIDSFTE